MNKLFVICCLALIAIGMAKELTKVRPQQTIGVSGTLKCNGKPASRVLVKLYDHDTFTFDDKIASGRTDQNGHFSISGTGHEISRVTPKFNIYHDCQDFKPCQRKVSITIPKSYITSGNSADLFVQANIWNQNSEIERTFWSFFVLKNGITGWAKIIATQCFGYNKFINNAIKKISSHN